MKPCLSNVPKSIEEPSVGNWDGVGSGFRLMSGVAGGMSNPETKKRSHQKSVEIDRKEWLFLIQNLDSIDQKEIRQRALTKIFFGLHCYRRAGVRRPRHLGSPQTRSSVHAATLSALFLRAWSCLFTPSWRSRLSARLLRAVPRRLARRLRGRPRSSAHSHRATAVQFSAVQLTRPTRLCERRRPDRRPNAPPSGGFGRGGGEASEIWQSMEKDWEGQGCDGNSYTPTRSRARDDVRTSE
jgi:hypothetical protein